MKTLDVMGVTPKVLELLEGNPTISYSIIANEVGVTRERIRQIAQKNGYTSRKGIMKPKVCPFCGETFYRRNRVFCSPICAYKARHRRMVVKCNRCGEPIERKPGTMRSITGRYYCNRVCFKRRAVKNHSMS